MLRGPAPQPKPKSVSLSPSGQAGPGALLNQARFWAPQEVRPELGKGRAEDTKGERPSQQLFTEGHLGYRGKFRWQVEHRLKFPILLQPHEICWMMYV